MDALLRMEIDEFLNLSPGRDAGSRGGEFRGGKAVAVKYAECAVVRGTMMGKIPMKPLIPIFAGMSGGRIRLKFAA